MKRKLFKKSGAKKAHTGAPSGFMISLIFHGVAFFIAGIFVVFQVLPKEEPVFEPPPPVERPKMNLKKPKVKVQKSSTPKPSSRIVAKVKTAKMPEIAIPDLVGTGEGLMGGTGLGGDFLDMPEIPEANIFGSGVTAGKDLEVTFYSLSRKRSGQVRRITHQEYFNVLRNFVKSGWKTSLLAKYYHSPNKLYASCLCIPIVSSIVGPLSFGESEYVENARTWVAHYKGQLVNKDGITFRFWGTSDDVLTVAINKEVVLAANFPWDGVDAYTIGEEWNKRASGSRTVLSNDGTYQIGNNSLVGSEWITMEPGQVYDFDAIAGEGPGGEFMAYLLVEFKDEDLPTNDRGNPIFPLFATEPLPMEVQDAILMNMNKEDCNVSEIPHYFIDE